MTPIDAALNRSRTVIALLVLILAAGLNAYVAIPKESRPEVNVPIIYVLTTLKGVSPEDADRLLVRPMEAELDSVEGVKEIRSTAFQGGASVLLEFEAGFDADRALEDVREKVDIAKADLPDETEEPRVHEVDLSLLPILVVTLGGQLPERALLRLAERRGADRGDLAQPLPQRLGDVGHGVEVVHATVVEPLHHLLGAVGLLAQGDEERRHRAAGHAEQIGRRPVAVAGGDGGGGRDWR